VRRGVHDVMLDPGCTPVSLSGNKRRLRLGGPVMKPQDPVRRRISEPFANGAPTLVDAWTARYPDERHPDSFCIYDRSSGAPHCSDYIFVTQDLAPRIDRVFYDQDKRSSDHQPVLLALDI